MTDLEKAARQALEALATCQVAYPGTRFKSKDFAESTVQEAITALRTAIEQAEKQEPVAWRAWFDADSGARWLFTLWPEEERLDVEWQPLYTTPPNVATQLAAPVQEPSGLQPIETIRYWLKAYSDPASGEHFMGHGMVVKLLREYLSLREKNGGNL